MLIRRNLHIKSSEVSIKTRSTPASLSFKGQATKHTTIKWSIEATTIKQNKSAVCSIRSQQHTKIPLVDFGHWGTEQKNYRIAQKKIVCFYGIFSKLFWARVFNSLSTGRTLSSINEGALIPNLLLTGTSSVYCRWNSVKTESKVERN